MKICIRVFLFIIMVVNATLIFSQDINTDFQQAGDYFKQGRYDEAGKLYEKWLPSVKETNGENDTTLYNRLVAWAGICFYRSGAFEKAEFFLKESMRINKEAFGENHLSYSRDLFNLASLYFDIGQFDKAEPLIKDALRITKESLGEKHSDYGKCLSSLANIYIAKDLFEKAEPMMLEALRITKTSLGENHSDYGDCLNSLSQLYCAMGRYKEAESLMNEAIIISKVNLGENHPSYGRDLFFLSQLYENEGQYEKAESLKKDAIRIIKVSLGENHIDYGNCLNSLAILYKSLGRYSEAEPLIRKAMQIVKVAIGENNSDYVSCLNSLAKLYQEMGMYDKALEYLIKAIQITKVISGENHSSYALLLNNLAGIYLDLDNNELAISLMKEAMRIDKEFFSENHQIYGTDLHNIAQLYQSMGRYNLAEPLLIEAIKIFTKSDDTNPLLYGNAIASLGMLYLNMGRFVQALPLMQEAMQIEKNTLGENHPSYGIRLNNLAQLYSNMGRYDEAVSLMRESIRLNKESTGDDNPEYAILLNNLAQLYHTLGNYQQSESIMKEVIKIDKKNLGENHSSYAMALNNLALLYQEQGAYEQAEPLLKEALSIFLLKGGELSDKYRISLDNLALLYRAMAKDDQVEFLLKKSYEILKSQIKLNSGFLSEKEVEQFSATFFFKLDIYQSINIDLVNDHLSTGKFAFDIELYRKGALLRSAKGLRSIIFESNDTLMINDFTRLISLRKQIDRLYSIDSLQRYQDLKTLEMNAAGLEKNLTKKSKDYRKIKLEQEMTWTDIQKSLKQGEAAIEFTSFRYYDKRWTDSTYYCAIILQPDYQYPKMIFLFEERELKKVLSEWTKEYSAQGISQLYNLSRGYDSVGVIITGNDPSNFLYNLIWKPIDTLMTGVNTVWYSPSGLLNRIAFNAITNDKGNKLSDLYQLNFLTSTRELFDQGDFQLFFTNNISAAIFGGINYNWNDSLVRKWESDSTILVPNSITFNWVPEDSSRGTSFKYLPGTLKEAKQIDRIFREHNMMKQHLFISDSATEANFKSLSGKGSPTIIHLATHGFFFEDIQKKYQKLQLFDLSKQTVKVGMDPLFHSGLLFAGANRAWNRNEIPEGFENGILLAKEVSYMDLRNTRLVVLSACETGLGEIDGNEGVYGLQRAFKMAGVDYILMSLWSIPDEATRRLMVLFYENCFRGQPLREAFNNAQKQLRESNVLYEDPYYWAGFVLIE